MLNYVLQSGVSVMTSVAQKSTFAALLCPSGFGTPCDRLEVGMMLPADGPDRPRAWPRLIAAWAEAYRLGEHEVARLESLLEDPPVENPQESLSEELRLLMEERKLPPLPPLTAERLRVAQKAVDAGLALTLPRRVG